MTYTPGDVIRYDRNGKDRIGVVTSDRREGGLDSSTWAYWRDAPGIWVGPRWVTLNTVPSLTLHPDPDPILADFAAWRLTQ